MLPRQLGRQAASLGIRRETKNRFDIISEGYKADPFLNCLMDLWGGMSAEERGAIFDRSEDVRKGSL